MKYIMLYFLFNKYDLNYNFEFTKNELLTYIGLSYLFLILFSIFTKNNFNKSVVLFLILIDLILWKIKGDDESLISDYGKNVFLNTKSFWDKIKKQDIYKKTFIFNSYNGDIDGTENNTN